MSGVDYEDCVRKMWTAFERDGVAALRPYVGDDVEWTPSNGAGTIRGFDELVAYWETHSSMLSVVAHAWEVHGEAVLVHGSLRMFRDGGFVDTQPSWVYFFGDGALRRAVAYASRDEALAAIGQHRDGH